MTHSLPNDSRLNYLLLKHAANGDVAKVKEALEQGANINCTDAGGNTALITAMCCGFMHGDGVQMMSKSKAYLNIVRELLKHNQVNVNLKDESGIRAIDWACECENLDFLREILKHPQLDVNAQEVDGVTTLMAACIGGYTNVVIELLKHDAINVNAVDKNGDTALIKACLNYNDDMDVIHELLVNETVDVNVKNNAGRTALMVASAAGSSDLVDNLVEHVNIDVDAHDNQGRTAFYLASHGDHWDVAEALLYHDINANVQGPIGYTALFWATVRGKLDVVSMLLKHENVDVSVKNKAGSTPLDVARIFELADIAQCLKGHSHS